MMPSIRLVYPVLGSAGSCVGVGVGAVWASLSLAIRIIAYTMVGDKTLRVGVCGVC